MTGRSGVSMDVAQNENTEEHDQNELLDGGETKYRVGILESKSSQP